MHNENVKFVMYIFYMLFLNNVFKKYNSLHKAKSYVANNVFKLCFIRKIPSLGDWWQNRNQTFG